MDVGVWRHGPQAERPGPNLSFHVLFQSRQSPSWKQNCLALQKFGLTSSIAPDTAKSGDTGGVGVAHEAPFGEGHGEAEYIVAKWQAATYSAVYLLHLGLLLVLPFVMELWLELDLRLALRASSYLKTLAMLVSHSR